MLAALLTVQLCCGLDMGASPWPQMPPPQYVHPYHGHLIVHTGTPAQLYAWCHGPARACAQLMGSSCTIWLPVPTPGASPEVLAALRTHEIGHCNGWRH